MLILKLFAIFVRSPLLRLYSFLYPKDKFKVCVTFTTLEVYVMLTSENDDHFPIIYSI